MEKYDYAGTVSQLYELLKQKMNKHEFLVTLEGDMAVVMKSDFWSYTKAHIKVENKKAISKVETKPKWFAVASPLGSLLAQNSSFDNDIRMKQELQLVLGKPEFTPDTRAYKIGISKFWGSEVKCSLCGKMVEKTATKCPNCKVVFSR